MSEERSRRLDAVKGLMRKPGERSTARPDSTSEDAPVTAPAPTPQKDVAPTTPPIDSGSDTAKPDPRPSRPKKKAKPKGPVKKMQMNVYIPIELRNSTRAAYKATDHLEGYESYSDFVTRALAAEVDRLERKHNNGRPFTGGDKNLPSGRPFSG